MEKRKEKIKVEHKALILFKYTKVSYHTTRGYVFIKNFRVFHYLKQTFLMLKGPFVNAFSFCFWFLIFNFCL